LNVSAINIEARRAARKRIGAVFAATAFTRFMLGGMNKSQWERDRHLRTKKPNAAGLPAMQQRIDLGYGVKGPADVPASRIAEQKIPDALNVGTYGDRLDGKERSYSQEGRYQIRDARAVLSSHLRALVSLGIARATGVNAPDRVLVCDPTGVVHLSRTATPITVYYRMTDDSATMARFSLYQMPMFSVSLQLIDDPDVFYRSYSNLIARPQLLLLAFERELTDSVRSYGLMLRAEISAVAASPIVITVNDHQVCPSRGVRCVIACCLRATVWLTCTIAGCARNSEILLCVRRCPLTAGRGWQRAE